jgi:hypothetical protein
VVAEITLAAFFSYSREDSEFALRLAGDLKAAGANVWLDQLDITPGQRWDSAVEDALKNCPRLIVVLSPAAVKSQNVMDEVSFALEERKTVIPVIHRDCDIPFRLRRVQHADFRQDYARSLQGLIGTLIPGQGSRQGALAIAGVPSGVPSGIAEAPQRVAEQARLDERRKAAREPKRLEAKAPPLTHLLGPVLIDTAYIAALWTVISIVAFYLSDQFQHAPRTRAAVANWIIWLIEQYFAGLIVVTVLRRFRPTFRRIHLALLALVWPVVYLVTLTIIHMWAPVLGEGGPLAVGEALVGAVAGLILSMDVEERPWIGALVGAVSFGFGQLVARLVLNSVQAGLAANSRYIVDTVHFFTCGILEAGPLVWYLHFRANCRVER